MSFWWCLEHKQVEEGLGCGSTTRLGPYETQQQAATAIERIGKREKEQQKKDEEEEKKWGKKTWLCKRPVITGLTQAYASDPKTFPASA